ncbi:MAG: methyltransferase domain-containing protein, partial [Oscillospiraceae bacterium]|nr:methyltransferase domain-containing protein [Oscillospiraceae bacterium]
FLYAHRNDIKGRVLEISESYYSNKFGSAVNKHEVLHAVEGNPSATIIGDLCNGESLPSGNMDCFICTQTLNYIYDVNAAVHGAWQVLRPGGVLLGSVAGISQVSSYDAERWGDFWRFTDQSIKRLLLDRFNTVEVKPFGNRLAALAFLDGIVVEDLPDQSLLDVTDTNYQLIIAFRAIR